MSSRKLTPVQLAIAFLLFLVWVENLRSWREFWDAKVVDVADRFREVPKIVPFVKARELGEFVQPDIDQGAYAGFF